MPKARFWRGGRLCSLLSILTRCLPILWGIAAERQRDENRHRESVAAVNHCATVTTLLVPLRLADFLGDGPLSRRNSHLCRQSDSHNLGWAVRARCGIHLLLAMSALRRTL